MQSLCVRGWEGEGEGERERDRDRERLESVLVCV